MSEAAPAPSAPVATPQAPPVAPAEGAVPPAQNTAEQAPASPQGSEQKPSTEEQPDKRTSRRFERRLDKAYRRAAEAEAREKLASEELTKFRQAQGQSNDPASPKLEQFKDIEEYAAAKAKYESDKVLKEHQAKQRTETQKQAHTKLLQGWEEKVEQGASKYDDFDEVVGELNPNSPIGIGIMRAPNGVDIAHYLGKHLKEAHRIAALEPVDQLLEIGMLGAKLAAEPPKPKTPSRAPAPINPLTGAAPATSDVPSEEDDLRTWMRKRTKQVHGNRK